MKKRKTKRKSQAPILLGLGLMVVLVAGGIVFAMQSQNDTAEDSTKALNEPIIVKNNPSTIKEVLTAKVEAPSKEETPEKDKEVESPEGKAKDELDHSVCKKLGYCIHKEQNKGLEDESKFKKEVTTQITDINVLKSKIKPLYEDKKLEEVLGYLDSYNGPEQSKIKELRKVIELQIFAANKIAASRGPLKPLSKNPRKEVVIDHEAIAREEARRNTIERELRLHNDIVGVGMDKLIVFNDRGSVIKYSKLVRACEDKASKFFEERRQKALQFLEDNKDTFSIIPHNKQKVKIRQGGSLICQVYYGTTETDEYDYKTSKRHIGYILTYDLKPLPQKMVGGFSGGC